MNLDIRIGEVVSYHLQGHFLIYIHYNKKWLYAVIDGPFGYLYGYIRRSVGKTNVFRIRENYEKEKHIRNAKRLL